MLRVQIAADSGLKSDMSIPRHRSLVPVHDLGLKLEPTQRLVDLRHEAALHYYPPIDCTVVRIDQRYDHAPLARSGPVDRASIYHIGYRSAKMNAAYVFEYLRIWRFMRQLGQHTKTLHFMELLKSVFHGPVAEDTRRVEQRTTG